MESKCDYCGNPAIMYNEESGNYLCSDCVDVVFKKWMESPLPKNAKCASCKGTKNLIPMRSGSPTAMITFVLCWDCAHKIMKFKDIKE
jgi:ribosomal protein S27E